MSLAGTRLGPYEILSLIGAGGMGEVYRARDPKLGREVAIKILPPAFAADPDRLARFDREARVLASLNHPHIAQIYGVEETGGVAALVLELVDGQPLDARLKGGRAIPIDDALAIARQIADALDAAHERGVIHRDLKPANIVLTRDGSVKVLDFGLATERNASSDAELTHSPTVLGPSVDGVLLGTAPYMSPEQARGRAVDRRTDIWAFGCVLYEMLTGRRAFAGETTSDTIAAILERGVDWTRLPAKTPPRVVRVLRRCLERDPGRRLHDAADARFDLEDATDDRAFTAGRQAWARGAPVAIAIGVVAAAMLAALVPRLATSRSEAPPDFRIERLTFDAGITQTPAISPDGRLVAYASDRAGRGDLDIWIQQLTGGGLVRVTDDPNDDTEPQFSSDGSQIAFRSERGGGGVYLMSALGGAARLLVKNGRNPRFSPDGTRIVYWTGQFRGDPTGTESSVFIVPLNGGEPQRVADRFNVARDPIWAPDGRSILIVGRRDRASPLAESFDWWWVPLDGRPPVKTGALDQRGWRDQAIRESITFGDWRRSGVLVAIGGSLWSLPISWTTGRATGAASQLALGAGLYRRPTASSDDQIVFADMSGQRVIERVALVADGSAVPPEALHADGAAIPLRASMNRDGTLLIFERRSGRRVDVWQKNVRTGSTQIILSVDADAYVNPTVSPDGTRVGYTAPTTERVSVTINGRGYVADIAGGVPRPLCDNCGVYEFLSDSRHAVVSSGDRAIQILDIDAHEARDVVRSTNERIERPSVSPDDRLLAFRKTSGSRAKVFVAKMPDAAAGPVPSGAWAEVDEPTTTGRPAGWSPDSRTLYLLLDVDGYRCLWAQKVDESGRLLGKPVAARHFHDRRGSTISTSLGNAIGPVGFFYETTTISGNLWKLTQAGARSGIP
jgi:eukaryotic-like serine/threonine-protein kinase